uniref:Chemokine interleukin-8-like domain-containing protein n=1 Tax=Sinocyclocheilus anshuiensis TaxID=1608454 RepID=A0A671LRU7_9TELE
MKAKGNISLELPVRLLKAVKPRWIRAVELLPPSPSCSKTEIIKLKVCLDPNKRQGQRLLKGKWQNKKQRNRGRKEKIKKSDNKDDY